MKIMLKRFFYLGIIALVLLVAIYLVMHYNQEGSIMDDAARKDAPGAFVTLTHGTTHYTLTGPEQGMPVVLIHGGGITGMEVWNKNIPYLEEKGYRILAYDLYGRGYSDRPKTPYTPELLYQQVNELLDTLNFPDSLHIISMSLGSLVATEFASKSNRHVISLTLIDPALTGDYRPNPLLKIPILSDLLLTLYWYPQAIENQRKEFVNQPLFDLYSKRLHYFMRFKGYKHVNYSTWMNTLMENKLPLLGQMPPQKVMLIYGEKDPYFPTGNLSLYKEQYPTLRITEVEQAGHMPHYEKPEDVNTVLEEFMRWTALAEPTTLSVANNDLSLCYGSSVGLRFYEGLPTYQWLYNQQVIEEATSHQYNATEAGMYVLRYKRADDTTWYSTKPLLITSRSGTLVKPLLRYSGSSYLPVSFQGINNEIILSGPPGYARYYWYKNSFDEPFDVTDNSSHLISNGSGKAEHAGTYYLKVLQPNNCISLPSNSVVVTWHPPDTGKRPKAPAMRKLSSSEIAVSWEAVADAKAYEVWRFRFESPGIPLENWTLIATVDGNLHAYTDTNLKPGGSYRYLVRVIQKNGQPVFSAEPIETCKLD
jgi:pimeloyl-ACP methyl ester carboxylesterase